MKKVLSRLSGVTRSGEDFKAYCPAHKDDAPSLAISQGEGGRVLLNCHAGCPTDAIMAAAGLEWGDLFTEGHADAYEGEKKVRAGDRYLDLLNSVYRKLIGRLSLSDEHRKDLLARGLSIRDIDRNGYRSLSVVSVAKAARALWDEYKEDLLKVPGFSMGYERRTAVLESNYGLLIPVRTVGGKIAACQIRTGEKGRKYVWLSSPEAPSGAPAHVPEGVRPSNEVVVTEGPLKADVVFARTGRAVVAVPGVGNWRDGLPSVATLAPDRVLMAFDMDWQTKDHVREQLEQFEFQLRKGGLAVRRLEWDPKHKGIDDVLLAGGDPFAVAAAPGPGGVAPDRVPADPAVRPAAVAPRKGRYVLPAVESERGVFFVRASDIKPQPVEWLWDGVIPFGAISSLEGDPGLGKSTLTCLMAAAASTGKPLLPGMKQQDPMKVVIMSGEDDISRTYHPRLEMAGADMDNIEFITACRGSANRKKIGKEDLLVTFPDNTEQIGGDLIARGVRLFIVDPLFSFLSSDVDSHKDADIRRVLYGLHQLVQDGDMAMTIIRHMNKDTSKSFLHRGSGSIGISGQARSVLTLTRDPDNEDRRLLFHVKNNLGPRMRTQRSTMVAGPNGGNTLRDWEAVDLREEDLAKKEDAKDLPARENWLLWKVAGRPDGVPVAEIVQEAGVFGWDRKDMEKIKQKRKIRSAKVNGVQCWLPPLDPKSFADEKGATDGKKRG